MFGLAAKAAPSDEWAAWYMETARGITETCHESYKRSTTGIGPEAMLFDARNEVSLQRRHVLGLVLWPCPPSLLRLSSPWQRLNHGIYAFIGMSACDGSGY